MGYCDYGLCVTSMSLMFGNAVKFNQNITSWNTSSVTSMYSMFSGARNFNQDISSWDTSNVNDMSYMFYDASNFNQTISTWTGSAATTPQHSMFSGATQFVSKWVCDNSYGNGPASSCNTIKNTYVPP